MQPDHPPINKTVLLSISVITSFLNSFMGAAVNIALPKIGQEFNMNAVLCPGCFSFAGKRKAT